MAPDKRFQSEGNLAWTAKTTHFRVYVLCFVAIICLVSGKLRKARFYSAKAKAFICILFWVWFYQRAKFEAESKWLSIHWQQILQPSFGRKPKQFARALFVRHKLICGESSIAQTAKMNRLLRFSSWQNSARNYLASNITIIIGEEEEKDAKKRFWRSLITKARDSGTSLLAKVAVWKLLTCLRFRRSLFAV